MKSLKNMTKRIQRKRVKGWKLPPDTVCIGRPSKWGNPFYIKEVVGAGAIKHYEIRNEAGLVYVTGSKKRC